ncbi:MAG: hypothetical protein IT326_03725 [Anaerolineae bacterium]|nr:hypothetical protein [Anaerolineae bacterium]
MKRSVLIVTITFVLAGLACGSLPDANPVAPRPTGFPLVPPRPTDFVDPTPLPELSEDILQPGTQPPAGVGLLTTPSLDFGIDGWDQWLQGGSSVAGDNRVFMADDPMYRRVVQFSRTNGDSDGGAAGITQSLQLNVDPYKHVYLYVIGRVLSEEGGNIANQNPEWFPEGAVQVRVRFEDARGRTVEWYHGFYTAPLSYPDNVHFSRVREGEWFVYVSPDLKEEASQASLIREVAAYGFGWGFEGQVASLELIGQ